MKQLFLQIGMILLALQLHAQSIQGRVVDAGNGEGLPFANVILEQDGEQKAGTTTDLDGYFEIEDLSAGVYDLLVLYVGFDNQRKEDLSIGNDSLVKLDFQMDGVRDDYHLHGCGGIVEYKIPLIDLKNTASGQTLLGSEVLRLP